jgi:hypothetical protein
MLLYKYRSIENLRFLLDILLNERLFCPEYSKLNDPFEGVFNEIIPYGYPPPVTLFVKLPRTKVSNVEALHMKDYYGANVCSLSSDYKDVRLWSHYGADHTGVAVEIDIPEESEFLFKVDYVHKFPEHGTSLLGAPYPSEVLSKKTFHWEYESEYRIIQKEEYFDITGMITRILAGPRATKQAVDLLQKSIGDKIPIVPTALDHEKLEIKIAEQSG